MFYIVVFKNHFKYLLFSLINTWVCIQEEFGNMFNQSLHKNKTKVFFHITVFCFFCGNLREFFSDNQAGK